MDSGDDQEPMVRICVGRIRGSRVATCAWVWGVDSCACACGSAAAAGSTAGTMSRAANGRDREILERGETEYASMLWAVAGRARARASRQSAQQLAARAVGLGFGLPAAVQSTTHVALARATERQATNC